MDLKKRTDKSSSLFFFANFTLHIIEIEKEDNNMKKFKLFTILFVVVNVTATICFYVCKKRVNITDPFHWKIVDDDWEHIIDLRFKD